MKRHHSEHLDSDSECEDYDSAECSSPDAAQVSSRKKRRGIIEKRRRDRINNCLAELKRLVPAAFEKQGSAKLEKAEILQMTVDHLKHLHHARDPRGDPYTPYGNTRAFLDYRLMGFREAVAEAARYMVSVEGMDAKDPLRLRVLNHLENYLAQRELAINAAIAASTHKTQATVNALFPAQPLPGFIPPQMAPPLNKEYLVAQKIVPFAATTPAPLPPFHIPVSTVTPIAFHPALGVTSIPVAMPTSAATKVESPTPSSPASGYKSPSSASSPRAPFRPWVTE